MWNTANGGSVGDGHGRITSPGNPSPGDWEEGEFIAFDGIETACGCQPSQLCTNIRVLCIQYDYNYI